MFKIDLKIRTPIYEQIVNNFKNLIITGTLKEDDKIPSVREMSKILSVNPNTIQKAYKELEAKGYFYTESNQGSFVKKVEIEKEKVEKLYSQIKEIILELKYLGETSEKIERRINDDTN